MNDQGLRLQSLTPTQACARIGLNFLCILGEIPNLGSFLTHFAHSFLKDGGPGKTRTSDPTLIKRVL
jgi:hypothetical protein